MGIIKDVAYFASRDESNDAVIGEPDFPGAQPPPAGVEPDLVNPSDSGRRGANVTVLVLCNVIVTALFSLRVYVKLSLTKRIFLEDGESASRAASRYIDNADDFSDMYNLLGVVLYSTFIFLMIHNGEGYHSWDISPEHYSEMLKWLYASSVLYCPAAYFTKVTLLLLIARVFAIKTRVARGLHIFIVALLVAYLPIQVLKIIICNPIRSYWDPDVRGHCLNQRKIFVSDVSLAILSDFTILVVPIPLIWSLKMSLARKLKVMILLGAGGIATGLTVFRLYKLIEFMESDDVAADFVLINILTILELAIGACCACLPAMNILAEKSKAYWLSKRSPQTQVPSSLGSRRSSKRSRLKWQGLGTTCRTWSKHQPKTTAGDTTRNSFTHARDEEEKEQMSSFDTELAALSGRAVNTQQPPIEVAGTVQLSKVASDDDWFDGKRADSDDGRREGWLEDTSTSKGRATLKENNTLGSTASEKISQELERARRSRPRDHIWDGSSTDAEPHLDRGKA